MPDTATQYNKPMGEVKISARERKSKKVGSAVEQTESAVPAGYFSVILEARRFLIPHRIPGRGRDLEILTPQQKIELKGIEDKERSRIRYQSQRRLAAQRGKEIQPGEEQRDTALQRAPTSLLRTNSHGPIPPSAAFDSIVHAPTTSHVPLSVGTPSPPGSRSPPQSFPMPHLSPQYSQLSGAAVAFSSHKVSLGREQVHGSPIFDDLEPLESAKCLDAEDRYM